MLISFSCFSQNINFCDIPKPVRNKIDSIHFKSCEKYGDTLYMIKCKRKELYRGDGFKMNLNIYKGGNGSIVGWTAFMFIGLFFTGMLLGL